MSIEKLISLRQQIIKKDFSRMNDMQLEAVLTTKGPLLVLAGAGSGKTTVLVNRIVNLVKYGEAYYSSDFSRPIREGDEALLENYLAGDTSLFEAEDLLSVRPAKPWQILAITFTNKAAGELKERICKALGEDGNDVWASTFHSTCAKILRRHADEIGYTHNFTIYDSDDSKRAAKECIKRLGYDEKMIPVKSVLAEISRAKDELITPAEFISTNQADIRLKKIGEVYEEYQKFLKAADAMDFDDLICNTVRLFQECPDVLEYYQNKFKFMMVDEYQDTNHAQYLFIKLLAQKSQNPVSYTHLRKRMRKRDVKFHVPFFAQRILFPLIGNTEIVIMLGGIRVQYNKVEICGVNTSKLKVLTEKEKTELLKRVKDGDKKAREELINGNLRLVLSVIQRFTNRGENLDDLFQVGCIGLMKAIDNFDVSQNVKFSTYALSLIHI